MDDARCTRILKTATMVSNIQEIYKMKSKQTYLPNQSNYSSYYIHQELAKSHAHPNLNVIAKGNNISSIDFTQNQTKTKRE